MYVFYDVVVVVVDSAEHDDDRQCTDEKQKRGEFLRSGQPILLGLQRFGSPTLDTS